MGTRDESLEKKSKDKPMREQLGTERHGIKKKIRQMKAKNKKKEGKISFNLSEDFKPKEKDFTNETLKMLAKLDNLATVSSGKIVEHNLSKKRQLQFEGGQVNQKKEKDESLLFTDEDIEKMSKQFFLHSKSLKTNCDSWKE